MPKRLEASLQKSELLYRSLFESSFDAIYISSRDGSFIEVNMAAVNLFGFSCKEEMLTTPVTNIYFDAKDLDAFQEEIEKNGFVKDLSVKFRKKSGAPMDCLLTAVPWHHPGGSIRGHQCIIRDITLEKRLKAQLIHSQKMEAMGVLASGIAHNFNNILMTIQGTTSLMLTNTDPGHPHHPKLRTIEQYTRYGADLIHQLLGFARNGSSEKKVTNLNRFLQNSARLFSQSRKEIRVDSLLADNLWPVLLDSGQMEQVIINLLVNAWQAMPEGGDIHIQTKNIVFFKNTPPYPIPPGKYVQISITDTGIGMDAETSEKAFDPFFTTKKNGQGTGLGLSTAYGIIKQHQGYITVYSEKGKGTTFNIYLPAHPPVQTETRQDIESGTQTLLFGNETILVVDDEEQIRKTTREMLEALSYTVLTARNGAHAIEIYNKNKDQIRLVILDLIMPSMSGGETFDRLKIANPLIKILLSSGHSFNGQAVEIVGRGCSGFIQKPFTLADLSHKVRDILNDSPCSKERHGMIKQPVISNEHRKEVDTIQHIYCRI